MVKAFGLTAVMVADPPKATVDPLYVTELFVRAEFGILVNVLDDPDIDLLVSV